MNISCNQYLSKFVWVALFSLIGVFALQSCREKEFTTDEKLDLDIRLQAPEGVDPLDVSEVWVRVENIRTGHRDSTVSVVCQPLRFTIEKGNYNISAHGKRVDGKLIAIYSGAELNVACSESMRYTLALQQSYVPNPDWKGEPAAITSIQVLLPVELATMAAEGIVVRLTALATQKVYSAATNARGIAEFVVEAGEYSVQASGELVPGKTETQFYGHQDKITVGSASAQYSLALLAVGVEMEGEAPYQLRLTLPESYSSSYSLDGAKLSLQKMGTATTYELTCAADGLASIASLPYGMYALHGQVEAAAEDGLRLYVCKIPYTELKHLKPAEGATPPAPLAFQLEPLYPASALVFKEIYFTKSRSAVTNEIYNEDGYVELYNNSDRPIYIDGVSISETWQVTSHPKGVFFPEYLGTDIVTPGFIFTFPGSGREHKLEPGQSVIMAENALNHKAINPGSPVDLSHADFEMLDNDWHDTDTPEVPNMITYFTFTATVTDFHNRGWKGWLIWKVDKPMPEFLAEHIADVTTPSGAGKKIYEVPSRYILDGVISAPPTGPRCRPLPVHIDVGYTYCSKNNIAKTIRRKVAKKVGGRYILQDTNNSSVDFIPDSEPSPKVIVE